MVTSGCFVVLLGLSHAVCQPDEVGVKVGSEITLQKHLFCQVGGSGCRVVVHVSTQIYGNMWITISTILYTHTLHYCYLGNTATSQLRSP